jgi:hypothetical protein
VFDGGLERAFGEGDRVGEREDDGARIDGGHSLDDGRSECTLYFALRMSAFRESRA